MNKKLVGIGMLLMLSIGSFTPQKILARDFQVTNGNHTFKSAWEETVYYYGDAKLVYGYNTFLFNEDYCHSKKQFSVAYLTNGNGTHTANAALYTKWSKIEVMHKGNSITYGGTH